MGMKILFQGDSITDCGRRNPDTCGANCHGLGPGYPSMVANRLMCDHPEKQLEFINRGISGDRVVDLYARWKVDCLNLKPDIVSIFVGVNDTLHGVTFFQPDPLALNGVEVPRYERIYRELLQWTKDELPNVKFVLIDPFLADEIVTLSEAIAEVAERRKVVARLAAEFGAVHIETQALMDEAFKRAPQTYWTPDGVHLFGTGHQLLADAWIKATAKWV